MPLIAVLPSQFIYSVYFFPLILPFLIAWLVSVFGELMC